MRTLPAVAALGCALVALAACVRGTRDAERAAPARTSTEQTVPHGTSIAPPGTAPSATIVR